MRQNSVLFFAWLTIALMLIALPSVTVTIPRAEAAIQSLPTLWRPYGPYARQVLATVFTNEISELAAFQAGGIDWFDWTIPRPQIPGLIGNPDALVSNPIADAGMFQIDFNHRFPILGVQMQEPAGPCSTDPLNAQFNGLFGVCSTLKPTAAGIEVRRAIAHLVDKAQFVATQGDCAGGFCVAIDDPIPGAVCADTAAPCSTLAQRTAWDAGYPHSVACTGTPCAYHVAAGGALGAPSGADLQAARQHLAAAGLVDSDGDGQFDFPATGQTIFAIRSDDPRRLQLGTTIANAIDLLFEAGPGGIPVVSRLLGDIGALGATVFFSVPDTDFGLYTGGWGLGLDATHIFPLYNAAFASNFCGGNPSLFNLNYGFYCNNAFDVKVEKGTFDALTLAAFNSPHQGASDIAGKTAMNIPVYARTSRTLAHNGWEGVLDVKGDGIANTFNWFNMRQKPGFVPGGGLGLPGGGNPDLLRAGFRQGTSRLNIFHAGTVWESYIIFNIYDSPGGFNPRAVTNPFFEPYETGVTSVREIFNDNGADQIPGTADDEPVTVIELIFRNDLQFHDGSQVTAVDFLESGLAYRDVPQGGFGSASSWEPVVAHSIPIPGANCGNLCVQLVLQGKTFLHKLNMLATPILPIHLWDTNGDGKVCSALELNECAGRGADATVDVNFDPMAAGIMVGHGPWMCLSPSGVPGGSCSQTAAGGVGGQSIGPGGSFLLTRNDANSPVVLNNALHRFAQADVNDDWVVDVTNDFVLAAGNPALQSLIIASLDIKLAGGFGPGLLNLNDIDRSNTGNAYLIGPP